MDFSKFLDDNFEVKDWVNSAFKIQKDPSVQKDAVASSLVMKLQLFIQEVNNSIEETSLQAVNSLPRVLRDVEAVKQEASFLQEQMKMVKEDIKKVEHDTAHSMQMLLELDKIKSRMQAASSALKEADKWSQLVADVDEVFATQNVQAISDKLLAMQHSLSLLAHCGDYEERYQYLETLKNRLEAILSPQLINTFNNHSLELAKKYVQIFTDMERISQLYIYYYRCHKASIMSMWKNLLVKYEDQPAQDWLAEFYESLLSTWHTEFQWSEQVFPDPLMLVCQMLTQSLNGLEPSLPSILVTALRQNPLTTLIELRQISLRFLKNLEAEIKAITEENHSSFIGDLVYSIHAPFIPYLLQYGELQKEFVLKQLANIPLDKPEMIESVEMLEGSVGKIFSLAQAANEHCMSLTGGFGYVGLCEALKSLLISYCGELRRVLNNLRARMRLDDVKSTEEEVADLAEDQDWTTFQHTFRIIQTCGELILNYESFCKNLSESMASTSKQLLPQSLSPTSIVTMTENVPQVGGNLFQDYNYLVKSDPVQHAELVGLLSNLHHDDSSELLPDVLDELKKLTEHAHRLAFDTVFYPLKQQILKFPEMEIWSSEGSGSILTADLPSYSLSPLEYITKIGQYLMTLPQQLEPFIAQENAALEASLRLGRLPFHDERGSADHMADYWLGSVARGIMHIYVEGILKIKTLTAYSSKQLTTDIDYLCNVLDALGVSASENISHVQTLLKTPPSELDEVGENIPQKLVIAVMKMKRP